MSAWALFSPRSAMTLRAVVRRMIFPLPSEMDVTTIKKIPLELLKTSEAVLKLTWVRLLDCPGIDLVVGVCYGIMLSSSDSGDPDRSPLKLASGC